MNVVADLQQHRHERRKAEYRKLRFLAAGEPVDISGMLAGAEPGSPQYRDVVKAIDEVLKEKRA